MDDLTVKIQCLCNGVVCHAETVEDVKKADEFAIGTLPSPTVLDVPRFYADSGMP